MIGITLGTVASKAAPAISGMLFELGKEVVKSVVREAANYYMTKAATEAALQESDIARQVNHIERCVMSFGQ